MLLKTYWCHSVYNNDTGSFQWIAVKSSHIKGHKNYTLWCHLCIKGILSRKSIFLYVKGFTLLSSETYFLSSSGMINPLIFIIFFKILVIVVGEKCLPGPKLGCEIWLPVQNLAVRCAYRSVTCLSNMHTSPILVGDI